MAAFDSERHQRWRSQVVLGPLPDDFLRVQTSAPPRPAGPTQSVAVPAPQQVVSLPPQVPGYAAGYSPNVGVLEITVNQARLTKNYGLTRMDPFCRVRVGHSVMETPTASNGGKNPRWNKLMRCNVPAGVTSLYLEVFDERTFQVEERVAWCHVDLPERLLSASAIVDEWYPLNGKQGEGKEGVVNAIMSFTPVQQSIAPVQVMGGYHQPMVVMPGQPMPVQMVPSVAVPQAQPAVVPSVQSVRTVQETDVQNLVDMFPAMPRDTVRSILENCGGNMERAVDTLVTMGS